LLQFQAVEGSLVGERESSALAGESWLIKLSELEPEVCGPGGKVNPSLASTTIEDFCGEGSNQGDNSSDKVSAVFVSAPHDTISAGTEGDGFDWHWAVSKQFSQM